MLEPFFLRANLNASLEGATRHGAVEMGTDEISDSPPRDPKLEQRLESLFPEATILPRRPRPDLYAPPPGPLLGRP